MNACVNQAQAALLFKNYGIYTLKTDIPITLLKRSKTNKGGNTQP